MQSQEDNIQDSTGGKTNFSFRVSVFREKPPHFIFNYEDGDGFPVEEKETIQNLSRKHKLQEIKDTIMEFPDPVQPFEMNGFLFGSKCLVDCLNFFHELEAHDSLNVNGLIHMILGRENDFFTVFRMVEFSLIRNGG